MLTWVAEMTAQIGVVENAISQITEATKFSQNPSLQNGNDNAVVENTYNADLSEVEQRLVDTPDSELTPEQRAIKQTILERQQKNITQNGDVDSRNVIDLSTDNELSVLLGDLKGAKKYKKIRDYIFGLLGGRNIELSDGKNAIVDKSDALHIANKSGTEKTAQISKIKEIIQSASLYAEDNDVEHNKFNSFCYYQTTVKYGDEIFPIYINVGKAINDGKYHIYDITKKIRDTAHRVNDVERPKPNEGYALENGISNTKVPQKALGVKTIISNSDQNNTQADPNGPANFMPEGENEGDVGLSEPDVKEIHRDPTSQEENEAIFGKRKDAKQRHILDVAKKLDSNMTVVFVDPDSNKLSGEKGAYWHDANTIYLSTDNSVVGMYCQLFKHEFVHRLESKKAYQGFKDYLFKHSLAFERYIRAELKRINGADFDGTREEALKALSDHYIDLVKKRSFTEEYKRNFTAEYAEREMVANFVGKVLFKGKENIADVAQNLSDGEIEKIISLEDTFAEFEGLNETERSWFQRIIDTIKDFIATLKGIKQNERLVNDLEYIEQRLARVLDSKDTKKAASRAVDRQYFSSEDTNLHQYIKDALSGNLPKKSFYKVNKIIPDRLATDIEKIVGFSVKGYSNEIAPGNIQHIENEHGPNGRKDQSMKNHHDLARISFVVENYEKIKEGKISGEYKNSDGTNSKTVVLQKKINDEFYYVVEAVPDATLKTLHIISAYKNKKDTFSDVPVSNDPRRYVHDEHQPNVSNDIILNEEDIVKNNISEEAKDYTQTDGEIKQSFALDNPIKEDTDGPDAEPSTPNDMPTERFIKTIIETGTLTDEMLEGMQEKLLLGDFSYEVMSDKAALEKAEKTIEYGTAENIWQEVINNNSRISKNQIAIGEKLLAKAIKEKDTKKVLALSSELADDEISKVIFYGTLNIPKDGGLKVKTANITAIKIIGIKQNIIFGFTFEFLSKILCVMSVIITEI